MFNPIVFLIGLFVFSQNVLAQVNESFPEPLTPFESATLFSEEKKQTQNYILALGPYEKISNRWEPEKKRRLAGLVLRQTYEISRDYSQQDVYDFYVAQLADDSELLYRCESFNCGASNNWANAHFGIKQLYGLDRDQFYQVSQLSSGEYITIYVVRRGNRRIFAQIEIIKPASS